jgi:hypothetical protein
MTKMDESFEFSSLVFFANVIDPKEFVIMFVCYRTCWVIHLKLYYLLW